MTSAPIAPARTVPQTTTGTRPDELASRGPVDESGLVVGAAHRRSRSPPERGRRYGLSPFQPKEENETWDQHEATACSDHRSVHRNRSGEHCEGDERQGIHGSLLSTAWF